VNLADAPTLKAFLQRHGAWARKGLGQHFLCSAKAVQGIVSRCMGCAGILEIGPGPGVLTSPLSSFSHVIALEVDEAMIDALGESAPEADVRRADALKADLTAILTELAAPRAVVSNLPYYITGPLLTAVAGARRSFDRAVLMMQKEVGMRVLAPAGSSERGSLSVFLQAQFAISKVLDVPAGAFYPPPKVDSVVLEFVPLESDLGDDFFGFVRMGFTQPRKTLANNLATGLKVAREAVHEWLRACGLDERVRAQELDLDAWRRLFAQAPKRTG
jgi:16S rRNA (adenine1518-N6/adenine1519-N6)-dimethyltransferase